MFFFEEEQGAVQMKGVWGDAFREVCVLGVGRHVLWSLMGHS